MANIGHRLRIKFGLRLDPSPLLQQRWADRTAELIRQGHTYDNAGLLAAKEIFPDFQTHFYASEGDTIEFLLRQAKDK